MGAKNAPVAVVAYNRLATLKMALENLSRCHDVLNRDIYLFLDAPYRKEDETSCSCLYQVACSFQKECLPRLSVVRRDRNYGVPGNIIQGITEVVNKYGKVIFIEDDDLVSETFLQYMDWALDRFEADKRIWGVNGYQSPYFKVPAHYDYDVYLNSRHYPWGFGTWANRWNGVDFQLKDWGALRNDPFVRALINVQGCDMWRMIDGQAHGRLHTWDVQCSLYMALHHMYSIEPIKPLVKNIGFSRYGGVHCNSTNKAIECQKYYNFSVSKCPDRLLPCDEIVKQFYAQWIDPSIKGRIIRKLFRMGKGICGRNDVAIDCDD